MSKDDFKHFDECDCLFRNSKGKVKPGPNLPAGVQLADTHCHLGMLRNPSLAIARAAHYGFGFLECITDPAELREEELSAFETYLAVPTWQAQAEDILASWNESECHVPVVRMACGVHPHNARLWNQAEDDLHELLQRKESSCLGEIGLDYHYDFSPRGEQREVFARQLNIAQEYNIPVSLHLREAHDDAVKIMEQAGIPKAGVVLHCFNLAKDDLAPFLEMDCYIAFGGPLTFKRGFDTRDALLDVPLNRILLETDAPYMAPEPLRGVECGPEHAAYTLRTLLDCFGFDGEEKALSLITPRQIDVAPDTTPEPLRMPDYLGCQHGLSQQEFAQQLYANALEVFAI